MNFDVPLGARIIAGSNVRAIVEGSLVHAGMLQLADFCYVYVARGAKLSFGRNVYVGRNATISCFEDVSLGSDVRLGERVSIHDENHTMEPIPVTGDDRSGYHTAPISIGNRVWIGANAVILPGARVGDDCVVGAGSVVRGEFPAGMLIAGVPATTVRRLKSKTEAIRG